MRDPASCWPSPTPSPSRPRPLALDFCCGRGGWTAGLVAVGFDVVGVDLLPQPDFPRGPHAHFIQADIRTLRIHELKLDRRPLLAVASPPCEPFSTIRRDRGQPPTPEGFELVAHAFRLIAEAAPDWWAIENVRGAVKWWAPLFGDPDRRDNPYYVWGKVPDAFRPQGPYPSKLRHRDPGQRSEIPFELAEALGRAVLATSHDHAVEIPATGQTSEIATACQLAASRSENFLQTDSRSAALGAPIGLPDAPSAAEPAPRAA